MEKKDWELIITLYETKNITKAATKLFMSQPTVTYRLNQIEKELAIKIIHRGRRGVEFTEKGLYLLKYAEKMIENYQDMFESISNLSKFPQGMLRLGVAKGVALHTLPDLLARFHEKYPLITFEVDTGLNPEIVQDVYKEHYHIGIIRGDHHWSDLKIDLFDENLSIISLHPITLDTLHEDEQIAYKTDPALNMLIDSWWRENYKHSPKLLMQVTNMEIAKKMVLSGLGYAIVPTIIIKDSDPLYKINLYDKSNKPLLWNTRMIYKNNFLELSVVREFVQFIESQSNN